MKLIDSHTHLYLEQFDDDRDEVIQNAINAGIERMLLPAIDKSTHKAMMDLNKTFPDNCLPMIGLHPTSVKENFEEELEFVFNQAEKKSYCGIGEIGIDLYWDKTYKLSQQTAFKEQLRLAKKLKLAVAIHTRDSFDETYQIVKEEQDGSLRGVFHCFTGDIFTANKIMDVGFFMGIGGIVTFKNSGQDKVVKDIPLQNILLETDSPFLTPTPYRGKRNESAYIKIIAAKIAAIKQMDTAEVANITTANSSKLFNFDF